MMVNSVVHIAVPRSMLWTCPSALKERMSFLSFNHGFYHEVFKELHLKASTFITLCEANSLYSVQKNCT